MTTKPILFSGPMVRALLDGRKTQTRRVLKDQSTWDRVEAIVKRFPNQTAGVPVAVGDVLWVREAWGVSSVYDGMAPRDINPQGAANWTKVYYWPTGIVEPIGVKKRPSIHMPRWVSRLTLEVKDVRVQRLHDINEEDAKAEGAPCCTMDHDGKFYEMSNGTHRCGFAGLWSSINGADSWDADPWIVAISFTVHKCNVDQFQKIEAAA